MPAGSKRASGHFLDSRSTDCGNDDLHCGNLNNAEKKGGERLNKVKKTEKKAKVVAISYHMKCAKTANGLTHFVMYGDVPKKKMPL